MKLIRKTSKSLLCALGLVAINLSWASDWVSVGMSDAAVYGIDRASVEKEGPIRRVWSMLDYRQRLGC